MPEGSGRIPLLKVARHAPVAVVLAVAAAYAVIDLTASVGPVPGSFPPLLHALAVVLQAVALLARDRAPLAVHAVVTGLHGVVLGTSGGELGLGSLAVIVATYTVTRRAQGRHRYVVVTAGAVLAVGAGAVALAVDTSTSWLVIAGFTVARLAVEIALPAAAGELVLSRDRLHTAELRRAEVDQRTALARELHDIAAHHLTGIIVSAQAASALAPTDPGRTQALLRDLQQDARTTMADLRRTVGLLRSHDEDGSVASVPTLSAIPHLVRDARERGQEVVLELGGTPAPVGPLAETAGYRMVQESLANAARHAPGAACLVRVTYAPEHVEIVVENEPARTARRVSPSRSDHRGYGLSGMEERADLIGATLTIEPRPDSGWRNRLVIHQQKGRASA